MKEILFILNLALQIIFNNASFFSSQSPTFKDFSNELSVNLTGYLAAFADFNADRTIDLFVINESGGVYQVDVVLMAKEDFLQTSERINLFKTKNKIRNIVVGDFNGDSFLDVLIYSSEKNDDPYSVSIAYGKTSRRAVEPPKPLGVQFATQPLHLDWNADMIGDLLGLDKSGKKLVLLLGEGNNFTTKSVGKEAENVISNEEEMKYTLFADINNDGQADVLFVGRKDGKMSLKSLIKINNKFIEGPSKEATAVLLIGQPVLGDFDLIGELGLLVPVCEDKECNKSLLVQCSFPKSKSEGIECKNVPFSSTIDSEKYTFMSKPLPKLSLETTEISQMNCGDLFLTGYIDCFVSMKRENGKSSTIVRLANKGPKKGFVVEKLVDDTSLVTDISQIAIFDLEEDGIFDLLSVTKKGKIKPLKQVNSGDGYFVKVMVLNGLCNSLGNCPGSRLPFGIPLPGIEVSYRTEAASGGYQQSVSTLNSDSSFTSLQLPYIYFGLGTFANYIEKVFVRIPSSTVVRSHTLSFIVPKTQIVVIPYPLDEPMKWSNKLFLEPFLNRKVIYVAAALLGTMLVVAIVLCILQYLEIREDRQEKMKEAQKFHFDAM